MSKGRAASSSRFFSVAAAVVSILAATQPVRAGEEPVSPCLGGTIGFRSGAELDYGASGYGHDRELVAGESLGFAVVRRCANDSQVCHANADCDAADCVATCDCDTDSTCEITGPITTRRCVTSLEPCTADEDCDPNVACVSMFAPPQPVSTIGVPSCIVSYFDEPLVGTADLATGELDVATVLRWRMMLGISVESPCPRCGPPAENPHVGDAFTCEGGPDDGATCTVHGVTPTYGGVSYDCAPNPAANVTGQGLSIRLDELTTATVTRTAELPCAFFSFRSNPLTPATPGKCLDDDAPCTSNADCRRCTGDGSTACDADEDCPGNGTCAEAPDQPVSCGFWCHCGFCDGNASLSCFDDSQCPAGQQCEVGTGTGTQANRPQQAPNDCSDDSFLCGQDEPEQCAKTTHEVCSANPLVACSVDEDCGDDGPCIEQPTSCFESRITRSGAASPPASRCSRSAAPCSTSEDCEGDGDVCVDGTMAPELAAVFCSGASSSAAINATHGITGPSALTLPILLQACRCDGEEPGCEAFCTCVSAGNGDPCEDGDPCTQGDSCEDGACTPGEDVCIETTTTTAEPSACGDWNDDGEVTASDAQGVLQAAVGIEACAPQVCDWDGSGTITSNDALAVLRASVALPSTPACPA